MSTRDLRPWTYSTDYRHFLIDLKLEDSVIISEENVREIVEASVLRFVGTHYADEIHIAVTKQSGNKFICKVEEKYAVAVRCALCLPPLHIPGRPAIDEITILQESSYQAPLVHSSRRFFAPLVE